MQYDSPTDGLRYDSILFEDFGTDDRDWNALSIGIGAGGDRLFSLGGLWGVH